MRLKRRPRQSTQPSHLGERPRGRFFPEEDFTSKERVSAIADLLLKGVTRAIAKKRVEKTRKWRRRKAETTNFPSGPEPKNPE